MTAQRDLRLANSPLTGVCVNARGPRRIHFPGELFPSAPAPVIPLSRDCQDIRASRRVLRAMVEPLP
jgi:hypothetical protein